MTETFAPVSFFNKPSRKSSLGVGVSEQTFANLQAFVKLLCELTVNCWASYPIITFSEVPPVDVVLVNRPGQPYLDTGGLIGSILAKWAGDHHAHHLQLRLDHRGLL